MTMEACGSAFPQQPECAAFIGSMGDKASAKAAQLVTQLRDEGFWAECDTMGRSVKAQMKFANKLGARFSAIIGDSELEAGTVKLKRWMMGRLPKSGWTQNPRIRTVWCR